MGFSKLLSCVRADPKESPKKEDPKKEAPKPVDPRTLMQKGYPITRTPFIPDILNNIHDWKVLNPTEVGRSVGFALASRDSDSVRPESLAHIRERIYGDFKSCPGVMQEIKNKLPRNVLAVSISEWNFKVGDTPHEYLPRPLQEMPADAFLTYQKLSETMQATYYNKDGIQFLAGICFYTVHDNQKLYVRECNCLVYVTRVSRELYPVLNRTKTPNFIGAKKYGRYCKEAGKRVVVDFNGKEGVIRHFDYNYFTKEPKYEECDECYEDFYAYKWVEPIAELPIAPVSQEATPSVSVTKENAPEVATSSEPSRAASSESLVDGFETICVISDDDAVVVI